LEKTGGGGKIARAGFSTSVGSIAPRSQIFGFAMTDIAASNEPVAEFGPAMRALHPRWQRAVIGLFIAGGNKTQALRYAGFKDGNLNSIKSTAWKIFADPRMKAAVLEECANHLGTAAPEMLAIVAGIARSTKARDADRLAATRIYLDRGLPLTTTHRVEVEHHLSVDQTDMEHYRALQALGAPQSAFLARFGHNGLARVETMIAAEDAKHKLIEADYQEVATDGEE
jgi:hypothetical protein